MYTELIFGVKLKKETPKDVIETLRYMLGEVPEKPESFPFQDGRGEWLFQSASYYFGISTPSNSIWLDKITNCWHISTRSNIKNYEFEIELFLEWIKPHIDSGSGYRDMYAIVIYEESDEPTIYYLHD